MQATTSKPTAHNWLYGGPVYEDAHDLDVNLENYVDGRDSALPEKNNSKPTAHTRGRIRLDLTERKAAQDVWAQMASDGEELAFEIVHLRKCKAALLAALKLLHDNIAEYARINNLGGFDNHDMRMARAAISKAGG